MFPYQVPAAEDEMIIAWSKMFSGTNIISASSDGITELQNRVASNQQRRV